MNRGLGFWLAAGAAVLVGAAIVGGLAVVGGPGEARLEKLDDARLRHLRVIERAVRDSWRHNGVPPPSFESLDVTPKSVLTDPETGVPYTYRVLSDSTAELCATFATVHDAAEASLRDRSDIGAHSAGLHCFTLYPPRPR